MRFTPKAVPEDMVAARLQGYKMQRLSWIVIDYRQFTLHEGILSLLDVACN